MSGNVHQLNLDTWIEKISIYLVHVPLKDKTNKVHTVLDDLE